MKKIKIKRNKSLIIGIALIVMGIVIGTIPFFNEKKVEKEETKLIEEFMEVPEKEEEQEIIIEKVEENKPEAKPDYSMVIEINKISLKKGLYDINSKYNKVKYNIQILKESDMPNIKNGNLILASHRGSSSVSYFNELYKLNQDDLVNIYYKNIKYIYSIDNIYETEKDGTIVIHRDNDKSVLVLITCKKGADNKQLVFIGNMIKQETY